MPSAITFHEVSKRYRLGRERRSLRDTLAALPTRRPDAGGRDVMWALRDVSFEVASGEAIAVIGPNGAGKSTILKLIGNILAPTRGEVVIRGRVASLLEMGAGFHPDLTGRENVFLNGSILGMRRSEIKSCFDSIVDFAELQRFIDTPVKRYSSGMYMRLAFAIAVHVTPDILLVDEVLAVGDRAFQDKSLAKARELQSEARTIVFVSHNLYAVQSLCTRGIFLNQGRVEFIGPVRDAIRAYEGHVLQPTSARANGENGSSSVDEWQSNGVRIASVKVCDEQGLDLDQVGVGQPLVIQIGYEAEWRIERPIVAVQIVRSDGVACASASTRFDGYELSAIEARGKLQVTFDPLILGPGTYMVSAHVYDQTHSYAYASWRQATGFRVTSMDDALVDSAALYHLPHRWSAVG